MQPSERPRRRIKQIDAQFSSQLLLLLLLLFVARLLRLPVRMTAAVVLCHNARRCPLQCKHDPVHHCRFRKESSSTLRHKKKQMFTYVCPVNVNSENEFISFSSFFTTFQGSSRPLNTPVYINGTNDVARTLLTCGNGGQKAPSSYEPTW